MTYKEKFANFIKMCDKSEDDVVAIHHPEMLGDTYEEIVESLNRLADAGLLLGIVPRDQREAKDG